MIETAICYLSLLKNCGENEDPFQLIKKRGSMCPVYFKNCIDFQRTRSLDSLFENVVRNDFLEENTLGLVLEFLAEIGYGGAGERAKLGLFSILTKVEFLKIADWKFLRQVSLFSEFRFKELREDKIEEFIAFLKGFDEFPDSKMKFDLECEGLKLKAEFNFETGLIKLSYSEISTGATDELILSIPDEVLFKNEWLFEIYPSKTELKEIRPDGDPEKTSKLLTALSNFYSTHCYDLFYHMYFRQSIMTEFVEKIGSYEKAAKFVKNLDFEKCGLTSCHYQCLSDCVNLQQINLTNNRIRGLDQKFFQGLNQLEEIRASFNSITRLPKNIFSTNPTLKILLLSNNLLENLDGNIFASLTCLEVLDLSFNRISTLDSELFWMNTNLKWIYLNNNRIEVLDNHILWNCSRLERLFLQDNLLKQLPVDILKHGCCMEWLRVFGNRFEGENFRFDGVKGEMKIEITHFKVSRYDAQ